MSRSQSRTGRWNEIRVPEGATRHCGWGPPALARFGDWADVVVIVDVLSFTTAVDVATARGAVVFPFSWKGERAEEFARERNAELARKRGSGGFSLSPPSLAAVEPDTRVVLPSPNGSTLSAMAGEGPVFAGCLRNATAVATAARDAGERVLVVAAGERWPGDTLRPALEDWLGAGAILAALGGAPETFSAEADAARSAFEAARPDLSDAVHRCGSGLELLDMDYPDDVAIAAQHDVSEAAPRLVDGAYVCVSRPQGQDGHPAD